MVLNNDRADNIIDTISFGATLSSLIMSVVAIIFTIVSGKNGQEQLGKITEATSQLRGTAESLGEFKSIAQQIDKHVEDLFSKIDIKLGLLDGNIASLGNKLCLVHDSQAQLIDQITSNAKPKSDIEMHRTAIECMKLLSAHGSYIGALLLLACCYAQRQSKPLKFDEMGGAFSGNANMYAQGYLVASAACGVVKYNGELSSATIESVIDGMEDTCLETIRKVINMDDYKWRDNSINEFNEMRAYFCLSPLLFDSK